jgi:hypothetical protein
MVLLAVAVAVSISALAAGAIAVFSMDARVAAGARLLSAVLLLAALMLFAIVALRQNAVEVTSGRGQDAACAAGERSPLRAVAERGRNR